MMAGPETPRTTFATIAVGCREAIIKLLAAATAEGCCVKEFLASRDVQLMEERYNQLAGNMGALQDAKSPLSLDYRLRNAPLVGDSILNTLIDLDNSVKAGKYLSTIVIC
jgi:hypothetical protein